MSNMTPAVRPALGLEKEATRTGAGLPIYQEIFDNLSAGIVNKRSPANCPYPNNLCRGCRDWERCG